LVFMKSIKELLIVATLMFPTAAYGQDYRVFEQGEEAPEKGFFFSEDSFANLLAKIQADKETALSLQETELGFKHHLETLDLKEQVELTTLRLDIQVERSNEILAIKQEHLERLEELALKRRPDWVVPVAVIGTALATAGLSVGVAYAVSDAVK